MMIMIVVTVKKERERFRQRDSETLRNGETDRKFRLLKSYLLQQSLPYVMVENP